MDSLTKAKGLKKIYNSLKKPTPPDEPAAPIRCKTIAFHHAGYDPATTPNTVIFRLKGSREYYGCVCTNIVKMILRSLVDDETMIGIKISRKRGEGLDHIPTNGMLTGDKYFVHSPDPDNETNILYQFPLVASFSVWKMSDRVPWFWNQMGRKSIKNFYSELRVHPLPADPELIYLCNKSVLKRDKGCILSGADKSMCERAYVVPLEMREFWIEENLVDCLGDATTDRDRTIVHMMNGLALRADLCEAYDNGDFVLLPIEDHWRAHFFNSESPLGREFDQKRVKLSAEIPLKLLRVRIAIAAFKLAKDFLEQDDVLQGGESQGGHSKKGEEKGTIGRLIDID